MRISWLDGKSPERNTIAPQHLGALVRQTHVNEETELRCSAFPSTIIRPLRPCQGETIEPPVSQRRSMTIAALSSLKGAGMDTAGLNRGYGLVLGAPTTVCLWVRS